MLVCFFLSDLENSAYFYFHLMMSKTASLPPWEVTPSWGSREKRVQDAAPPVVQKVRFAHLENNFIPPLPPPPPEPVAGTEQPSNAHRRAISLPKNPRPVRPKPPSSPRPSEKPSESTNDSSSTKVADSIPPPPVPENVQVRTRSRSSTLPGNPESFTPSAPQTGLSLNTSYPTPPSSTKSPISPQKPLENSREDFLNNKSLPPAPLPSVDPLDIPPYKNPEPARKSRFKALKRPLSLKILPQSPSTVSAAVTPQSPIPPTPDNPPTWANVIIPTNSLRRKTSKQFTSSAYNGEVFAWVETEGSRVVSIGDDEQGVAELLARSPRSANATTGSVIAKAPKPSIKVKPRSRHLASPGYIQEKYSLKRGVSLDRDKIGDVVVSGGRSPGIPDEEKMAGRTMQQPRNEPKVVPTRPQRPESIDRLDISTFERLNIYDEQMAPPSPKPEPPPKESLTGPRLMPLRYVAVASPKEATSVGPAPPKLIPQKFLSPPSPEESDDDAFPYPFESLDDIIDETTLEVAPLRISKSSENTPTSGSIINSTGPRSKIDSEPTAEAHKNEIESPAREPNIDFQSPARSLYNDSKPTIQAPISLTDHLVSRAAPMKLYDATHSTFLRCCSDGRIDVPTLSRYLTQERIFLQAYIRYLALLLANISIPSRPNPLSSPSQANTIQADRRINARLTSHLIARLSKAQAQLSLFLDLAVNIPDLNLESWEEATDDGMTDATRMLIRLFDVIGSAIERGEKSVLVGMVVMWTREKVCTFPSIALRNFANMTFAGTPRSLERSPIHPHHPESTAPT